MKFRLLLLAGVLFCLTTVYAQYTGDVVHLNNGSFVKGEIIENMVDDFVKIKTVEGEIRLYKYTEIKEITTGLIAVNINPVLYKDPNAGFYTIFDLGFTFAFGNESYYNPVGANMNLVNGFHINPKYALGVGIGLEGLTEAILPAFAEGKYTLKESKFSPEFRLQVGYAFSLDRYYSGSNKGGILISPLIGFRNYTRNSGFIFSIGYRFQNLYSKYTDWQGIETKQIKVFNRFTLRMGFVF